MAERLPLLLCFVLLPAVAAGQQPPEPEPSAPEAEEQEAGAEEAPSPEAGAEEPEASETQEAGADAEPEAEAEDEEDEDDPDRIAFDLRLEDGRGTVAGSAGELELRREDYAVLTGGVEIHHQDVTLRAERAEVDLETREVVATGDVVFDQGPRRLAGATLTFDLDAKTGTLTDATAYVDPDYYFTGDEIAKVDEDVYVVTNGVFTSCEQDVPDWSFRLGRARVEVDAYARVRNASMRVKRLPVFYTPYIVWPTKEDRTAGLLVPNFGYTDRRGAYLGLAYYQPIGRSYDTTFFLDSYGEGFVGLGNELRYQPTEGTSGRFEGYAIRETEPLAVAPGGQDDPVVGGEEDEWRWRMELDHVSDDLPLGLRGVVDWTEYSDFQFFQDFDRDFNRNSRRFEDSKAFLTGNWGSHLVNVLVNDRETFAGDRIITDRQLPAIEYQLRSTPVWTTPLWEAPLYLSVDSSLAYLDVDRSAAFDTQYGRADLFPEVSIPLEPAPWLSLSLRGGYRLTWWGDSLETDPTEVQETGDAFTGESVTRSLPTWGADLIGPSFARVFDAEIGPFARFMHVIEPRVSYSFVDGFDRTREVPSFDSVDRLFSGNVARVSLSQRLKAKPPEEEGGSAREILTFELAQDYSFDSKEPLQRGAAVLGDPEAETLESQRGPLEATLRFAPSDTTSLRAEWRYSTLFDQLTSSSIAAEHRFGPHDASVRYTTRFRAQDGETLSDQIRLGTGVSVLPGRLAVRAAIDYDLERSELQEQRYFVDWTSQCYSVRFEFRDFQVGNIQDTDYRLAFTLKNVGTFLDLTGRLE
ncbi:MAG: LPS-assembly protein LptD [Gemmatimonadota bacterium]